MLYGHGDNGYRYDRAIVADFSSNIWYGGEPEGLKEHLFNKWNGLVNKYPEALPESLAQRIGEYHGLSGENILVTAGTTESIYLVAQLYRQKHSCIVIPSFSEYEDACRIQDHRFYFLPWDTLSPDIRLPDDPDLCWIGNPNNPSGATFHGITALATHHPDTLFIVDEAFIDFTQTLSSMTGNIDRLPNLVILRSLTKAFAIPGLRLGYIVADRDIIARLQTLKWPWSVNSIALEAGHYIFTRRPLPVLPLEKLLNDKEIFVRQLSKTGIEIFPSHTHFFLCRTEQGNARMLQQYLLDHHGLLIRDASNFRGLGPGHFRLATLAPEKNQWLTHAIGLWQLQYTNACAS